MEKKAKNICMIVYTDYLTDTRVRREAETLAALPEFNVTVLTLKESPFSRSYNVDGVRVVEVNEKKYFGKNQIRYILSYLEFMLLSFFACTRLFMSRKVDVVHVHNMPDFLVFSAIVPRLFGKKLVLDIHDSVPETYAVKFGDFGAMLFKSFCMEEYISCAFANEIICVNHVQRDLLVNRGISSHKIHISMNVLDHNKFNSSLLKKTKKNRKGSGFKMVYHGTITKRLGIDLVIEAMGRLVTYIPELEFQIWGRYGDDLDEIIRLSEELVLTDKIHFNEALPMDKLIPELLDMDLGIVGNRKNIATELMLPVKMLEYVALGIPVVVPKLKAIEYYFTDEMVSYFEPENIDSMINAVLRLYHDKSLREIQAEKAKAFLDRYGWETHQMDLITLYREL